jgi:hypothetical protein
VKSSPGIALTLSLALIGCDQNPAPRDDTGSCTENPDGDTPMRDGDCDGNISTHSLSDADHSFLGENDADWAGIAIAGPGDVDGDGLADLLVGAAFQDEGGEDAGKAYLFLARSLGSASDLRLEDADVVFVGEAALDYSNISVAGAGDVDGDGLQDLLMGAPDNDRGGSFSGSCYLFSGAALDTPRLDLSEARTIFMGENNGDFVGQSCRSAGDVDGDDLADILIGAHGNDETGIDAGKSYLFLGSQLGSGNSISTASAQSAFLGEAARDRSGQVLSSAGDVDGDGLDDLLFGAPDQDDSAGNAGKTYILLASQLSNGTISLRDADHSLVGESTSDNAGISVASAGDVDQDGLADILVGAFKNSEGGEDAGKAYLVLGSQFSGASRIDLAEAYVAFVGALQDSAGSWVASAGDVDADESDDILLGAPQLEAGGGGSGKTYLILGADLKQPAVMDLSTSVHFFSGEEEGDLSGYAVDGVGDVNGDGRGDLMVGAPGAGSDASHPGKAYLLLSGL